MKKILYILTVIVCYLFGWPLIIANKEKFNKFGRKIDKFYGIKSRHTENYSYVLYSYQQKRN